MRKRVENAELWARARAFGLKRLRDQLAAHGVRVSLTAIYYWFEPGACVPEKHVALVERITGIPKELIRPDRYPASASTTNASSADTSGAARDRVAHDVTT